MEKYISNLNEIRRKKGLTQKQLAELTEMSQSTISDIENMKYDVSLNEMWTIAKALKTCPLSLVTCQCEYCKGAKS